ncbi:DUF4301 family protein [Flavobacterium sp. GNP001]
MEENLKQRSSGENRVVKITLFGPESTGKTTLAKQLAAHYQTEWVPEFARDYLQQKWDSNQQLCTLDDMLPIAEGQMRLENESVLKAKELLFCDTNLMVTKVFSDLYYGTCPDALQEAAVVHDYDLFFLTSIDIPWEKDDIRDTPQGREAIFTEFKQALIDHNKPFLTLSGDQEMRFKTAVTIIDELVLANKLGFSTADFLQVKEHGIALKNIEQQLHFFKNGIAPAQLLRPAKLSDGILKLSETDFEMHASFFDAHKDEFKLSKFVPASGAASRMFKFLAEFLNDFDFENESINAYINRKKASELSIFIVGMDKFPFFEMVYETLKKEFENFDSLDRNLKNYYFIKLLLAPTYFNFANKPKGVLPFHKYETRLATPVAEHLLECVQYATAQEQSNLHFTVSQSHQAYFEQVVLGDLAQVQENNNVTINITYSYQNQSTDTIAVTPSNQPFRDAAGQLLFRPGGHGALIENLNQIEADIVFIKNIDNVVQNDLDKVALYKRALGGILIALQKQVFNYLQGLDAAKVPSTYINQIVVFLKDKFHITLSDDFQTGTQKYKVATLHAILNRPIRVCGMVKNEGEPGGGPFWVRQQNGAVSLQIVESSQVDINDSQQKEILQAATHFNPVDLVCGLKDYKNQKFNLPDYVDCNSGFIVEKNSAGQPIKGYELPGLWNGAMADWLTIFVQVPLVTFNPVKTVNDLLKPTHQSYN